jgi:hypothetical protein
VGEHIAVVWNRLYAIPSLTMRSIVGVWISPPNVAGRAGPASSIRTMRMFGASAGAAEASPVPCRPTPAWCARQCWPRASVETAENLAVPVSLSDRTFHFLLRVRVATLRSGVFIHCLRRPNGAVGIFEANVPLNSPPVHHAVSAGRMENFGRQRAWPRMSQMGHRIPLCRHRQTAASRSEPAVGVRSGRTAHAGSPGRAAGAGRARRPRRPKPGPARR